VSQIVGHNKIREVSLYPPAHGIAIVRSSARRRRVDLRRARKNFGSDCPGFGGQWSNARFNAQLRAFRLKRY